MLDLTQELKQKQGLTARQIQQVKLLEIPAIELEARIRSEIENNPALTDATDFLQPTEVHDNQGQEAEEEQSTQGEEKDLSLDDYREDDDIPYYKLQQISNREARKEEIPFASSGMSLAEHLLAQIDLQIPSEQERLIASYVIGSLREDGYLERTAEQISNDILLKESLDITTREVTRGIEQVQKLDPPGVAASTLQECLLLQLDRMNHQDSSVQTAKELLEKHYDAFVHKRYEQILQKGIDQIALRDAISLIVHMNPKPGNGFDNSIRTDLEQVSPDFIVSLIDDRLILQLTDEREIPALYIEPGYREIAFLSPENVSRKKKALSKQTREAQQFAKEKVEQAQWFISALQQRFQTLRITMTTIMGLQEDFFRSGNESDLKPMILKDVADRTGFDISTISRVSNSKYVQCDYGIFPLKFFFSEASLMTDGTEVSSHEVKRALQEIIENEDPHAPYPDQMLMELLQQKGFTLARRTVAKYREMLQIPVARMRRKV